MVRPLRIEFPDAVYHVTSRGDRRENIFDGDQDRRQFLDVLGQAMARFNARVLAYCQLDNHYHLVLHTRQANLSALMRQLNGVYTQRHNRAHGKTGHVFQGRFKAILVDRDNYLFELCRYVELNPVRAGLTRRADAWAWSSCLAHLGRASSPDWLDVEGLHGYLLGHDVRGAADSRRAAKRYAELINAAPEADFWKQRLRQQIYLGDEKFVERIQSRMTGERSASRQIPKAQRLRPLTFVQWTKRTSSREEALYRAHVDSGYTMTALAAEIGLTVARVSQLIGQFEREMMGEST